MQRTIFLITIMLTAVLSAAAAYGLAVDQDQAPLELEGAILRAQERAEEEFPPERHFVPIEVVAKNGGNVFAPQVLSVLRKNQQDLKDSALGERYDIKFTQPRPSVLNESALYFFATADNEKLGGGVFRRNVGADATTLEKERFNRKIEAALQSDAYKLLGIGIDLNLEAAEEGYSPSILGLIVGLIVVLATLSGVLLRFVRATVLALAGLSLLFVWIRGFPVILGLLEITRPSLTTEVILPIAFTAFGIDFFIHAVHRYQQYADWKRAFGSVAAALVLAMLTDAIAFGANVLSSVEAIRTFALTGAFAAVSAFFIMGVAMPQMLVAWDKKFPRKAGAGVNLPIGSLLMWARKNRALVIGAAVVLAAASIVAGNQTEKRLEVRDFISQESKFVRSLDIRDKHFGDTRGESAAIYLSEDIDSTAMDEVLANMQKNEHLAHTQVGELVLPYGGWQFNEEKDSALLQFEVTGTRQIENVAAAREQLEEDIEPLQDTAGEVAIIGPPFIREAGLNAVTDSMIYTFAVAAGIIFLVLLAAFRSIRYALTALLPMGFVALLTYGFMGVANVPLNFITATVLAISIGVGIDFSVHILQEYQKRDENPNPLKEVGKTSGFGVLIAGISSIAGFSLLVLAPMPLFSAYGLLASAMMAFALLAAVILLPALLPKPRQK